MTSSECHPQTETKGRLFFGGGDLKVECSDTDLEDCTDTVRYILYGLKPDTPARPVAQVTRGLLFHLLLPCNSGKRAGKYQQNS